MIMKINIKLWLLLSTAIISGRCSMGVNAQSASTLSSACDENVRNFDRSLTGRLISDIKRIAGPNNNIPAELRDLYAAGRDEWNSALSVIENSYSDTWSGISIASYNGPMGAWRDAQPEDYQKFFLLLTELRWGKFNPDSRDMEAVAARRESSDLARRINARIKTLQENCRSSEDLTVRKRLTLTRLPDTIEECL